MGNKSYNQQDLNQQDLNRLLAESKASGRGGYGNQSYKDALADQGLWLTSKEQFDELYKSVDDIEKFLRS